MSLQSSEDDDSLDEAIAEIVAVIEDKHQMLGELDRRAFNNYVDKMRGAQKSLFLSTLRIQISTFLHHIVQYTLIFNREKLQNFKSQSGPRR